MNIIRQALRSVNRLLSEGGGAIFSDGKPIFTPLASERVALRTLAASGGANRRRHIPAIVTGPAAVDRRLTAGPVAAGVLFPWCRPTVPPPATTFRCPIAERKLAPRRRGRGYWWSRPGGASCRPDDSGPRPPASFGRRPHRFYNFGHINARSLTPRLDEVNMLLEQQQLDIMCVSETWLRPDISSRVLIFPGFTVTRCDRTGPPRSRTPRGGGVAILTREHLRTTKLDIGGADTAVESLWLSVTGAGRRTVIVGAIYRPPGSSTARGLELIEEQLRAAVATCKPVVGARGL